MTASSNISPAFAKKKSKKNKDNFVKIEYEVHNLTKITANLYGQFWLSLQ